MLLLSLESRQGCPDGDGEQGVISASGRSYDKAPNHDNTATASCVRITLPAHLLLSSTDSISLCVSLINIYKDNSYL
jgi:hypothetical protein